MPEDLRILRIITRLNVGGPSLQAIDLSENQEGWKTRLLVGKLRSGESDMSYYMEDRNLDVRKLKHLVHPINPFKDGLALFELMKEIKEFKPHVVHTHHAKAGMLGRLAARLTGVPLIVHTFHGNVFRGHYSPIKSQVFRFVEKCLAPFAHKLIAISPSQLNDLCETFHITNPSKCEVIPLGFYLDKFLNLELSKEECRKACELPANVPLIGIVGRLTHVKNHKFFLEAFAKSKEEWHCVIIGDGELKEEILEEIKNKGLEKRVHLKSTQREIEKCYRSLDALAITSHSEGTPVTMIEAMATGLPVCAADVGGISDLADQGNRAWLYPSGDHEKFISHCDEILGQSESSRNKVALAKTYASETHSFSKLFENLNNLYRQKN